MQVPPRAQIAVEGAKADPLPPEVVNPGLLDVRFGNYGLEILTFYFLVLWLLFCVGALVRCVVCTVPRPLQKPKNRFLFRLHLHEI